VKSRRFPEEGINNNTVLFCVLKDTRLDASQSMSITADVLPSTSPILDLFAECWIRLLDTHPKLRRMTWYRSASHFELSSCVLAPVRNSEMLRMGYQPKGLGFCSSL
jgi:hypothetical protein